MRKKKVKNLNVYAGRLTDVECNENFNPFNGKDFSKCYLDIYDKTRSMNATKFSMAGLKLTPLTVSCTADLYSTLVMLPDGKVTNCWNNLASLEEVDDNLYGHLQNGKLIIKESRLAAWFSKTDISNMNPDCKVCQYLPVCLGGCPKSRSIKAKDCCCAKDWLEHCIETACSGTRINSE